MRSSLGRQRLDADAPVAARTRTGDPELLAGAGRERTGAAARGAVETLCEDPSRLGALAGPTQGRAPLDQRRGAFEQRGRFAEHGRGSFEHRHALRPPVRQPGGAQRDSEGAPAAEAARVGELRVRELAGAARIAEREERLRRARARVEIAGVPHRQTPDPRLPERHAGFEFRECFLHAALRQPQASAHGRNQHGADTGGQVLMRQEGEERLRFVELTAGDCDLREDRRGEGQSVREVSVLCDTQRDARSGVGPW